MIKNLKYILFQLLLLTLSFIGTEAVYLMHQASFPPLLTLVRILLFDLSAAAFILTIAQIKLNRITKVFLVLIAIFCAVYATAQLGFIGFLGNYVSFKNA